MKSLFRLPNLLILAVAIFALSSCTEDPEFVIPPSLDLLDEAGFVSADATVSGDISVKIKATKGDNPMKSLEFQESGARITDIGRITIDGNAASSAAVLLIDGEKDAFTWEVTITPHAEGDVEYTFLVTDDADETASRTITISVEKDPPTLTAPNGVFDLTPFSDVRTVISLDAQTNASGSALASLSVCQNGVVVAESDRFWFKGIMATDEFPGTIDLAEADQSGFTESLYIRANSTQGVTDSYTVKVTDVNGQTASLDITVTSNTGTPLGGNYEGVLLNQAGPDGQGGLDLDVADGGNINSTSPDAEIKDEGINGNVPATNWKQQISPANGSTLAYLSAANFPDGFDFDLVATKEAVKTAYDAATPQTVSDKVAVGDIFAVYNPAKMRYYLLKVTNIKNTEDDNKDAYTFDIKW